MKEDGSEGNNTKSSLSQCELETTVQNCIRTTSRCWRRSRTLTLSLTRCQYVTHDAMATTGPTTMVCDLNKLKLSTSVPMEQF